MITAYYNFKMTIAEFLCLKGTTLSDVVAKVDETVGLSAHDVLLAVGSIAEGLGNSKSDLDLLFITPRGESSPLLPDDVSLVVDRCLIDMRVLRLRELDDLLGRFRSWSQDPWSVTRAVKFTLEERTLLHRLLHGHVLYKGKKDRVTSRMPERVDLARLKLHVARHMSRTIQVDMVGYREVGDYRSLVFAAQEVLGHAVDALLAGHQLTNPHMKWRSRMLDSVPANWERLLAIRPTGLKAAEHVWRLHRAPERHDKELALKHAFRITTFARAVFMWAEFQLVKEIPLKPKRIIVSRMESKLDDSPLPCLDFDVDFFLSDEQISVARLNEFNDPIEMSPAEFSLSLFFDGTTTASEAARIVYGSRARSNVVDQLVSRVVGAGLVFAPAGSQGAGEGRSKSPSLRPRKK